MMLNHPTLHTLRQLKLTGMADGFERQITQPATHDELGFDERLALLVDREKTYRDNNKATRLLKAAQLKLQATPENIDYSHPRGLSKTQLAQLLGNQWMHQHHNILIEGPTGCGNTYLACALGTQACRHGASVRYFRTSRLLDTLTIAHGDGRFAKLIQHLAKTDLLLLDDWGLGTLTLNQRNDLLEIMEDRHGLKSKLIASQVSITQPNSIRGGHFVATKII